MDTIPRRSVLRIVGSGVTIRSGIANVSAKQNNDLAELETKKNNCMEKIHSGDDSSYDLGPWSNFSGLFFLNRDGDSSDDPGPGSNFSENYIYTGDDIDWNSPPGAFEVHNSGFDDGGVGSLPLPEPNE